MKQAGKTHKKLIEVALPLDAINRACKDDKDRKTGHIRNIHKWFAPMPLPAWRAALFASIVDDPGEGEDDVVATLHRRELFEALETILPLDAAKTPALFDRARALMRASMPELPIVIDPFCGGGSTILEAQRLGFRTIGSDLNPVPLLITTVLTKYPAEFGNLAAVHPRSKGLQGGPGSGLLQDIEYYSQLVGSRAEKELSEDFPVLSVNVEGKQESATVLSWIWCKSVTCPNPACGIRTPLVSSFELTKSKGKVGKAHWIEPIVKEFAGEKAVEYIVQSGVGTPPKPTKIGRGAVFACVNCKSVIDETYVREWACSKGFGHELLACVAKTADGKRLYLAPSKEVRATVTKPKSDWVPDLPLSTHPQYMGAPRYGMTSVGDLFTPRQRKTLDVFSKNVINIREEIINDARAALGERAVGYADAVTTVLALFVSKLSQSHNVLVRWKLDSRNGSGKPLPAFDTQTIPIVWDFAENNPFGGSVGDWNKTIVPTAMRAFAFTVPNGLVPTIIQSDAREAYLTITGPVLVATDPPYYDNVPYADLSDVFYPILRHMLQKVHPKIFSTLRAPRSNELVADQYRLGGRSKAQAYFLEGFKAVFSSLKDRMDHSVPMTVVYSFKQQESAGSEDVASTGWEVMLRALIESGFTITATWPIRTTLDNRSRDIESNALASAILIVCRSREAAAITASRREFVAELQGLLPKAIRNLQEALIAPVDLQQAMIGPGIGIFSKYQEVIDVEGKPLTVRDALSLINSTLDSVLTEQQGDFDQDTR